MQSLVAPVQNVKFDIETALDMQLGAKPLPFAGMDKSGSGICTFHLHSICDIGAKCPFRHVRADRTVVCKHWLRGLCKKGDDCEFLHEYDMSKMPECYFFVRFGQCGNKECPFLHLDPDAKRKDCPWYDRGFCRHGPHCKNRHVRRVFCLNYLAGFCPKGLRCKNAHPRWRLPTGEYPTRAKPTCHHCGEPGHVIFRCFKLSEEERAKLQMEQNKKMEQQTLLRMQQDQHRQEQQQRYQINSQENSRPDQAEQHQSQPEKPEHQQQRRPLEEVTCFKCGESGHFANRCPKGHLAFISLAKNQPINSEQ